MNTRSTTIARKNEAAELLETAGPTLLALLLRLTLRQDVAEDLMQDLFVRLARSRAFGRARNPEAYATRAAVNLAMDWRREEARWRAREGGSGGEQPAAAVRPSGRDDEVRAILDAAAGLRGLCREAFVLRFVHGATYGGVGAVLGRTPHQARALCRKGMVQVRRALNVEAEAPLEGGEPCNA